MENRKLETRNATCKKCENVQEWTLVGKYPNGIKKWRDDKGLTCNGRVCGTCNRNRVKDTMRKGRAKKVLESTGSSNEPIREGIHNTSN